LAEVESARGADEEIASGERFEFGENWSDFAASVDDRRIEAAVDALREALGDAPLDGLTFLDAGCGSGLSSLAARRLGASVVSFDFDPSSVRTALGLRARFATDDPAWTITEGSVLDGAFLDGLGTFDIVCSWGVLHHTGDMWKAIDLVAQRVKPGGRLFIAIYNDQGGSSIRWTAVKRAYNRGSRSRKQAILVAAAAYFGTKAVLAHAARGRIPNLTARPERGMSYWHDLRDWVGGYPFEVAKPEEVFDRVRSMGFRLDGLKTCRGAHGCNEYVFTRDE
jgi:2-polyprenyl-6-hydroxyphenyl methylase/3-demethylubiquinone-9 3-methyltransferase